MTVRPVNEVPVVAQVARRIGVMLAGKFVEVGDAEQVLHRPKERVNAGIAGGGLGLAGRMGHPDNLHPFTLESGH